MSSAVNPIPPPPDDTTDDILTADDLPFLDTNALTHSDLLSLCRTSNSYFDPLREDDVVIPVINRSIFNESAGSRRQTFTRVRLRHSHHRPPRGNEKDQIFEKKRKLGLELKGKIGSMENEGESFDFDKKQKVGKGKIEIFENEGESFDFDKGKGKMGIMENGEGVGLEGVDDKGKMGMIEKKGEIIDFDCLGSNVVVDKKKKVGVKGKGKMGMMENGGGVGLERVNKKGEIVDFDVLERSGDDLFAAELKIRTVSLQKEAEVLEFLAGLNGRWCSWRKKRKFVDASEFWDVLPIGWQVMVGVGKNDGVVSVVCFKYVSPSGQQFGSCKDAALFLRSHFVRNDAEHPMSLGDFSMTYDMAPPINDVPSLMTANVEANRVPVSIPVSDLQGNETLVGMSNLVEVQVQQRRPISEGVIIRDGKYECQFCHKIFEERRKYNGHVGVHVRKGYNQSDKQVDSVSPTGTFNGSIDINKKTSVKMKVEFADNVAGSSCMTSSSNVFSNVTSQQLKLGSNDIEPTHPSVSASMDTDKNSSVKMKVEFADKVAGNSYMTSSSNAFANVTNQQLKLGSNEIEPINSIVGAKLEGNSDQGLMHHDLKSRIGGGGVTMVEDLNAKSIEKFASPETDEMKCGISEQTVGYAQKASESPNALHAISQPHVLHNEIATSSELFMQSFEFLPDEFASGSEKGDYDFFKPDPNCPNVSGFDELGLDDLEDLGYSFAEGQDLATLPGPSSFDLAASDSEMKKGNPVRFDSEAGISNVDGGHLLTTSCVWCQSEFQIQTNDSEPQSDAIGYMCPACKDNIPGL